MNRNDKCFCGSGLKYKNCHSDIHEESFFSDIIKFQKIIDEKVGSSVIKTPCKAGCSTCCSQQFPISSAEFLYIMNNLLKKDKNKAYAILEKGYNIWCKLEKEIPDLANKLKRTNKEGISIEDYIKNTMEIYQGLGSHEDYPCVFLDDETKCCTVYNDRPLICRSHGVGYFDKPCKEENVSICFCDKTADGVPVSDLVDLSEISEAVEGLKIFKDGRTGQAIKEVDYPIYYYCKIYYNNFQNIDFKIHELKKISRTTAIQNKVNRLMSRNR